MYNLSCQGGDHEQRVVLWLVRPGSSLIARQVELRVPPASAGFLHGLFFDPANGHFLQLCYTTNVDEQVLLNELRIIKNLRINKLRSSKP
jgi:hypothetical protein